MLHLPSKRTDTAATRMGGTDFRLVWNLFNSCLFFLLSASWAGSSAYLQHHYSARPGSGAPRPGILRVSTLDIIKRAQLT